MPIGIAMLGDERSWAMEELRPLCEKKVEALRDFLSKSLDYNGKKPSIVVAPKIITSVKESKEMGEFLQREGVGVIILQYYIWNYPYLVWPMINIIGKDKPILNYSNNEGEYPGNVGLLATSGALRQAGIKTERIVGDLEDETVRQKILNWVRAAEAYVSLRGQVYGSYGGHSMGMETGYFHMIPFQKYFGITEYSIDQLLLREEMGKVSDEEVEKGFSWLSSLLGNRIKYGEGLTPDILKQQIRLYLAMKKVNSEYDFDFCGIKGQREFTENVVTTDVAEMLMNDPYDWNGPKEPIVCATESDAQGALTMQILKYVSGGDPVLFADVRLYVPEFDVWVLANSGEHSSWYASRSNDPRANFEKISLYPAVPRYFPKGGASVEFDAAPGEMTFARLGIKEDKPFMVIISGEAVDLPRDARERIKKSTDPTWPHMYARFKASFEEFIGVFPANHIHGIPGNHVEELTQFCKIADIDAMVLGK
ncbi:MAG: L-fucose/L-arabinose isomerase family protein [Thermoprotei archaeon]